MLKIYVWHILIAYFTTLTNCKNVVSASPKLNIGAKNALWKWASPSLSTRNSAFMHNYCLLKLRIYVFIFSCTFLHTECPIEGQVYTVCGTACPAICNKPQPLFCTLQCVRGCQCPLGTFLDELQNKCVEADECSKITCNRHCKLISCIFFS